MKSIHLVCCSWGDKTAKHLSGDIAWDRNNIIAGIMEGRSSVSGHRILCEELTPDERRVSRGFAKLSRGYKRAFALKYVFCNLAPPPVGTFWTNRQMAKILSINPDAFRTRVDRARREIQRLEFA